MKIQFIKDDLVLVTLTLTYDFKIMILSNIKKIFIIIKQSSLYVYKRSHN